MRSLAVEVNPEPRAGSARERRSSIARLAAANGRVKVGQLSATFGVSTVTIRKDLLVLEAQKRVVRTHGGAVAPGSPELGFDPRMRLQADDKASIGVAAARMIRDDETVVMDASTSALAVARQLRAIGGWHQLTIVTNGLRIASELAGAPGIDVLVLGGRVRPEAMSLVGRLGDGLFDRINVQVAIVGAAGLDLEAGLSDATDDEAQIKRSMVAAARDVIAVIDHTKWRRTAFATFCSLVDLDRIVTDQGAPSDMVDALMARGIDVTLAGEEPGA
jgi:DeoR/GlpR family transcriptional regulator of sugar metabolism